MSSQLAPTPQILVNYSKCQQRNEREFPYIQPASNVEYLELMVICYCIFGIKLDNICPCVVIFPSILSSHPSIG